MTNVIDLMAPLPAPNGTKDDGSSKKTPKPRPRPVVVTEAHALATCTDVGNSDRYVRDHGAALRYVGAWGKWLAWNGKRWEADVTGLAERLAKRTARAILEDALNNARAVAESGDEAKQKRARDAVAWGFACHSAKLITAMVKLSRSAEAFAIPHTQLDADPWLLNVENGTIDLRTGKCRAHEPGDLITKIAPVVYQPEAKCPTWDAFLLRAMGDDAKLVDYIARVVGYSITGVVREHILGFLFGGGANGKSTFLGTISAMLGSYATQAPRGLLFRSKGGQKHETEYTTLFGARFAVCAEIEEGAAFDEALVKDLTGGDAITARRMREDYWTFEPTHKLFIPGNHKPYVRGGDDGIWRRIRLVPWTVTIPTLERDPKLKEKLYEELPGILAWAVRGCMQWQKTGLGDPPTVLEATAAYREQSDPLREFFALHVVFTADGRVARALLREAYETYCKENGAEPLGAKRFSEALNLKHVEPCGVRVGLKVKNGWRGVRLATDDERARTTDAT